LAERAFRIWRHPRAEGADGRCIGVTDLPVDPRRARRLAERIRRTARRHGLPHLVLTSPSRRAADVGRWLRRWGWRHETHAALAELDFGDWDGRPWTDIPRHEVDAWCADFLDHRPGGGESLAALFARVAAWDPPAGAVVVGHGGWMLARRWLASGAPPPVRADQWPVVPSFGTCWSFTTSR
jgi:alpha-ribazole phosphatase